MADEKYGCCIDCPEEFGCDDCEQRFTSYEKLQIHWQQSGHDNLQYTHEIFCNYEHSGRTELDCPRVQQWLKDTPTEPQAEGITTPNTRIGGSADASPKSDKSDFANSQDVNRNGVIRGE
jgi:hypothetical protein